MTKVYYNDLIKWINDIKALGITKFTCEDLKPHGLNKEYYYNKARYNGLLKSIGRTKSKSGGDYNRIWEITG